MDLQSQYAAMHSSGVFADIHRTRIRVTGEDRASFLHNLCTNDVRSLGPGQGCEAFFTNVQGKVLGHALLLAQKSSIVIDTVPDQASVLLPHLDKYLIREDVVLEEIKDESVIFVAGPRVASCLPSPQWTDLSMLSHAEIKWSDASATICRVPLAAGPCFFLSFDQSDLEKVTSMLAASSLERANGELLELARLETGFPMFGRDISQNNLPQEVGRDPVAISFTKGCYLGQETVARIDALGHVNRHLVSLEFKTSEVPKAGTELFLGDTLVGQVTSASPFPERRACIGLGYVRRQVAESESQLSCSHGAVHIRPGGHFD